MNSSIDATADPFTSRLAGRRLGRYEVLARLAGGGMASVYVARALGVAGFERLFAVKVLHPHLAHEEEFITMFLDEARLAARIRHPNVVATIDISDTQDAGYYLVMDYIEGDHLGALLQHAFKNGERLPAPVALRVVVDALDGLAAAHNLVDETGRPLNLVHRDISPHNIMVSTDGIARITDFGVAKAEFRLSTTRDGQFKGKLAYMAPEHASSGESDQRSDLFAMAIILWESLAGRRLFRAENHAATLNKICLEPIPKLSDVDPSLAPFDAILQKGLSREPANRFQSAHEFAEAIEKEASSLGGLANPRTVAKLVREFAAEKITRDQNCIREAMAELSQAQEIAPVEESGPHQRQDDQDLAAVASDLSGVPSPAPAPTPPAPLGLPTDNLADSLEPEPGREPQELARSKRTLWVAAVVLGLAGGVAVATMLWGGPTSPSEVEQVPVAVQPDPTSPDQSPVDPPSPTTGEESEVEEPAAEESAAAEEPAAPASDEADEPSAVRPDEPVRPPPRRTPRQSPSRKPRPAPPSASTPLPAASTAPAAQPKPAAPTTPATPTTPAAVIRPKSSPTPAEDDLLLNPYR